MSVQNFALIHLIGFEISCRNFDLLVALEGNHQSCRIHPLRTMNAYKMAVVNFDLLMALHKTLRDHQGFIPWKPRMLDQHFMAIHPIIVEIFQNVRF